MSLLNNYDSIFGNHLVDAAMEAADLRTADEELAFEGKVKCGGACEGEDDIELDESDLQYILGEDNPDDDELEDSDLDAEEGCKKACESFLASLAKGMDPADESYDDGTSDDVALESAINSIYAALEGKCEDDEDSKSDKEDDEDEDLEDDSKSKDEKDTDDSDDESDEDDDSSDDEDESDESDEDDKKSKKKDKKKESDDEDDSEEDDDAEESFLDIFNSLV